MRSCRFVNGRMHSSASLGVNVTQELQGARYNFLHEGSREISRRLK